MSHHIPISDVLVAINDPRQQGKIRHDLVETLVVAICGVLAGADTFIEIELWAEQRLDWFRRILKLPHSIPSHDTFGRLFSLIDPEEFEQAFRCWVAAILPALSPQVVALDGKTSRRSGKKNTAPLHLVSAFAADSGLILGQRATSQKSNEKTAIPELLATLALEGCTVTIDAMGTQPDIAQAILDRGAHYLLAIKGNQPKLAEAIDDFADTFLDGDPARVPHAHFEHVEKDHGRLEVRRCHVFDQLQCLPQPERWPGLRTFVMLESERTVGNQTSLERRYYISSLAPDAERIAHAIRAHWGVENRVHWCMDVIFGDDQMRIRTGHAAHNMAVLKQLTLNLIRLDPVKRKGGIKARRLIAATSDDYRAELLGLR